MAQDAIAFMEALGILSAHLVGCSDGANTGMLVANPETFQRHPMLSKVVRLYKHTSPDGPEHFQVVFDKWKRMWVEELKILDQAKNVTLAKKLRVQLAQNTLKGLNVFFCFVSFLIKEYIDLNAAPRSHLSPLVGLTKPPSPFRISPFLVNCGPLNGKFQEWRRNGG